MTSPRSPWDDTPASRVKRFAVETVGFDACGVARAAAVDAVAARRYREWVASGRHGCMDWAARHLDVRDDPRLLLEGARSVVMVALNYLPAVRQPAGAPRVAMYAYGRDYHKVLRSRLKQLADYINELTGEQCRPCVDSAPLRERYWAVQAGLGFIGVNNTLILPGRGSFFFLGSLVTTAALEPDDPCRQSCAGCGLCVTACPTGALSIDGTGVDANRCLSCLTIENHDTQLPDDIAAALQHRVAGCDECQLCCPHNAGAVPTTVPDFEPRPSVLELTDADIDTMTEADFDRRFAGSAIRRVTLATLKRNNHSHR